MAPVIGGVRPWMVWCLAAIVALGATMCGTLTVRDHGDRYELGRELTRRLDAFATGAHLAEALEFGEHVVNKSRRMEGSIAGSTKAQVVKGSTSYGQLIDGYPTAGTQRQDTVARTVLKATSFFLNRFCAAQNVPYYECGLYLSGVALPGSKLRDQCLAMVQAKEYNDAYRRLLPAAYDDGIYTFRRSKSGTELPGARDISSKLYASRSNEPKDAKRSVALVQWTQFIEQDLAKTTVQSMHDGTDIECCSVDHGQLLPRYRHPSCKALNVSEGDAYYRTYRATCMSYVRSALSLGDGCNFGPANQLNQATNRLDLSQLYGNAASDTELRRTHRGGKLRSQTYDSVEYLQEAANDRLCITNSSHHDGGVCYSSGDTRVNVNPYVTLLHTLFLRSHNKLAKHLALLNGDWSDEQLFRSARWLNRMIYRKMVVEWLTAVIDAPLELDTDLPLPTDDRVSNEFATAAIRFYNTMMPSDISSPLQSVDLTSVIYRPKDLRKREYFSHLVSSVLQQNAMSLDTSYVDDLAHLLFRTRTVGLDVLALDIQRGRDHGLRPYTDYYSLCSGRRIRSWDDLATVLRPSDLRALQSTYATVDDVDLIVGAMAERPSSVAGTVGPTLACLIREQIVSSLRAEPDDPETISGLANYTAARFMCDTAQIERVQRDIFRVPADDNPQQHCIELPPLDLSTLLP